jgi:hypothetical protein
MGVEESEVIFDEVLGHNRRTCRSCCRPPNKLQETALKSLGEYVIVNRRPDGCVIVEAGGNRYFVDYEGRVFKEVDIEEYKKHYVRSSPNL